MLVAWYCCLGSGGELVCPLDSCLQVRTRDPAEDIVYLLQSKSKNAKIIASHLEPLETLVWNKCIWTIQNGEKLQIASFYVIKNARLSKRW